MPFPRPIKYIPWYNSSSFGVYCMVTAFEDFEYNTKASTKLLLETGEMVGEAKARLGSTGCTANNIPTMPVAYDTIVDKSNITSELREVVLTASKENTREQLEGKVPRDVLERMLDSIDPDKLIPDKVARVFWTVRALGTPMWIIHRQSSGKVLDRKFGQHSAQELLAWIQPYLTTTTTSSK